MTALLFSARAILQRALCVKYYDVFSRALTVDDSVAPGGYDEVMANVKLPTAINVGKNNKYPRTAFISLGIGSAEMDGSTVDIGIANVGDGWYPIIFDSQVIDPKTGKRTGKPFPYKEYKAGAGATRAVIVAAPVSPTQVRINVIFQDDYGNTIAPSSLLYLFIAL